LGSDGIVDNALTLKVPDDVKIWALYTAPGGDV
jgi:hypothetical protein